MQLASLAACQEVLAPWQQDLCITIGLLMTGLTAQRIHCSYAIAASSM